MYTYIQSRFYRAPEVILGGKYSMAIDVWSLGCILAELYTGFALLPGEDEADQLACMIELLGMPPQSVLDSSKRAKNFITAKGYPRYCTVNTLEDGKVVFCGGFSRRGKARGPPGSRELKKALKGCDDVLFLNFIKCCLEWDQHKRITPGEALKHSWFRRRLPKPPSSTSGSGGGSCSNIPSTSSSATTTNGSNSGPVSVTTAVANAGSIASTSQHTVASSLTDSYIAMVRNKTLNPQYLPLSMTTSCNNSSNNSHNNGCGNGPSSLRSEFFNGSGGSGGVMSVTNKMATLPNKLRVQISATSSDDIVATTASFPRTLHSSSSLTSLPQSSGYRPTTNNNNHHHHGSGAINGLTTSINMLQSVTTATTTKLPQIGHRNTIT